MSITKTWPAWRRPAGDGYHEPLPPLSPMAQAVSDAMDRETRDQIEDMFDALSRGVPRHERKMTVYGGKFV